MAKLEKLPWWIGFAVTFGTGLMGVFASDVLPEWAPLILFSIGGLSFLFGLVAAGWHFFRTEPEAIAAPEADHARLVQEARARLEAEEQVLRDRAARRIFGGIGDNIGDALVEIEAERKTDIDAILEVKHRRKVEAMLKPKYDMSLKDVLQRIAFESEWSVTRDWSSPVDHWQETLWWDPLGKEFLRPFASDEFRARGIRRSQEGEDHGHSDIPADYWRNPKLKIEAARLLCEPGFDYVFNLGEGVMYHDIKLRSVDVNERWPARNPAEIEANSSPFLAWADEWKACYEERLINSQMEYEELRVRAAAAARAAYYENRPQLTIREAACFVADVLPMDFEDSDKAQSIAQQLIYYATTGAMPIATEPDGTRAARRANVTMGGLEVPEVTLATFVTKEALEHYRDKALRTWMRVQDPARRRDD